MDIKQAVVAAPSICDFYFTPERASALGAIAVKDQLEKLGINAPVFNLPLLKPRGREIPIPESHLHLKPFILRGERGPVSFFSRYKRFGPDPSESAQLILRNNPQIVFISLFAWAYGEEALALAGEIRAIGGMDILIIIGGPGAAVLPEYFYNSRLFDFVSTGDGEDEIPKLIKAIKEDSLTDLSSSRVISQNSPAPALSFRKDQKGKQWLSMTLSKGCPLLCQFCSNFLTQGRVFRSTPLNALKEELNQLPVNRTENLHITLEDDNLLVSKSYFTELLEMIKEIFPLSTFSIDNGLDYTNMTIEFVDYLVTMGFNSFTLSLGSSDRETLKKEKRPGNFRKLEEILAHLHSRNIPVSTFLICGLPEDSRESIISSLIYLHNLPTEIGISLFYPVPGIPRFEDKQIFLNRVPSLCCGSSAFPWGQSLSTEEMVTFFRLARLSNFFNKNNKSTEEMELMTIIQSEKRLHTLQGKSKRIIAVPHMADSLVKDFLSRL
ncbi:MAG: radical SAM protein [Spirochaetaceae bacterium]|nr:radical SAM protein [Spirochaetaceae bacterium]